MSDAMDYRYERAAQLHDSGHPGLAIEVLTELLAEDPENAFSHGLLASCLIDQKRLVAAEYECKLALQLDPSLPFLHRVRARILYLSNKPDKAIEASDEALRLDPNDVGALLLKASVLAFKGNRNAQKDCLDQAAQVAPGSTRVAVAYGDYFNSIGQYETAFEYAAEALRENAADVEANVLMGETQLALGKISEAEYHAKFAITQNPESEEALTLFAHIKMRRSLLIGAWWRFNSWISTLGSTKSALVLIGGFVSFNLLSHIARDFGYPILSISLSYAWLLLVVYSWIGIPAYHRAMAKELDDFSFNPKF